MSNGAEAGLRGFLRRRWRTLTLSLVAAAAILTALWYVSESPKNQIWGQTVTSEPLSQKIVALTFDDGPNPPYTNQIIEYLHQQHAPATFFVVGQAVVAHPEVVRLAVADGNAIGNHTWDHAHLVLESRAHIRRELATTEEAIWNGAHVRTHLFRPPFGARDFAVIEVAHQMGYQVIMWSVPLPADWRNPPPQVIANRILKYVKNGSIIVLHDGNRGRPTDRHNSVEATKLVVAALKRQGFRFVTVPELMRMGYAQATAAPGPTEYAPFYVPRMH